MQFKARSFRIGSTDTPAGKTDALLITLNEGIQAVLEGSTPADVITRVENSLEETFGRTNVNASTGDPIYEWRLNQDTGEWEFKCWRNTTIFVKDAGPRKIQVDIEVSEPA